MILKLFFPEHSADEERQLVLAVVLFRGRLCGRSSGRRGLCGWYSRLHGRCRLLRLGCGLRRTLIDGLLSVICRLCRLCRLRRRCRLCIGIGRTLIDGLLRLCRGRGSRFGCGRNGERRAIDGALPCGVLRRLFP